MRIELRVFQNSEDAKAIEAKDLFEFAIDEDECENCGLQVGFSIGRFYPGAVCIGEDEDWLVCVECAGPIIFPGE
jgi:hypothetical protein